MIDSAPLGFDRAMYYRGVEVIKRKGQDEVVCAPLRVC